MPGAFTVAGSIHSLPVTCRICRRPHRSYRCTLTTFHVLKIACAGSALTDLTSFPKEQLVFENGRKNPQSTDSARLIPALASCSWKGRYVGTSNPDFAHAHTRCRNTGQGHPTPRWRR